MYERWEEEEEEEEDLLETEATATASVAPAPAVSPLACFFLSSCPIIIATISKVRRPRPSFPRLRGREENFV